MEDTVALYLQHGHHQFLPFLDRPGDLTLRGEVFFSTHLNLGWSVTASTGRGRGEWVGGGRAEGSNDADRILRLGHKNPVSPA